MASAGKSSTKIAPALGFEPNPDKALTQSPHESRTKLSLDQLSRSKSGVKIDQREPTRSVRKIPINAFDDGPETNQHKLRAQYYDYITMGRFQIDSITTTAKICLWVLLPCLKILSILTAAVFWIAAPFYLISLVNWQIPWKSIYFVYTCIVGFPLDDQVWRFLFPAAGSNSSYHLRVSIHTSLYYSSPAIGSTTLPILIDSPMALFFLMTLMFISHHLLCFTHDCLTKFVPTMRATGR